MLASVQNKQGTAVATAPDNPDPSNIFVWMKKKEEEKKNAFLPTQADVLCTRIDPRNPNYTVAPIIIVTWRAGMSPAALLKFRPAVEWVRALLIRRVISTLLSFRAITLPGSNNYTEVCLVGFAGWSTYARPRRLFFSFISPRLRIKSSKADTKSFKERFLYYSN